jgi:hypothetical protein
MTLEHHRIYPSIAKPPFLTAGRRKSLSFSGTKLVASGAAKEEKQSVRAKMIVGNKARGGDISDFTVVDCGSKPSS